MKTTLGQPFPDRAGVHGLRVSVEFTPDIDEWACVYHFATHGLSAEQIGAEHRRIVAHHAAKAARLTSFESIPRAFTLGGSIFTIRDIILGERGTDVEIRVKVTAPDGTVLKVQHIGGTVAMLPNDATVLQSAHAVAQGWLDQRTIGAGHQASVAAILGV